MQMEVLMRDLYYHEYSIQFDKKYGHLSIEHGEKLDKKPKVRT